MRYISIAFATLLAAAWAPPASAQASGAVTEESKPQVTASEQLSAENQHGNQHQSEQADASKKPLPASGGQEDASATEATKNS